MSGCRSSHTVSDDDATGDVAALYAEDREHHGYVPTRTRIMAVNPEALPPSRI